MRDRIKRAIKATFRPHPNEAVTSASETAITTSNTSLEPGLGGFTHPAQGTSLVDSQSQDTSITRDLWSLALGKLSAEEKIEISHISSDSRLEILQHLLNTAKQKQIDCDKKSWKYDLNGRQIILRDVAEKIIDGINKFKEIGDVAVNFDPVHASLPWAGVRFLLQTAVAENQQMGALLTGVERMTCLINRCKIYEILYLPLEQSAQEESKQAKTDLKKALIALYATILRFLTNAIRAYNRGLVLRTIHAVLTPSELADFLDQCQAWENDLEKVIHVCESIHARNIQKDSVGQVGKLKQILVDLQDPIQRVDSQVAALCQNLDSSERPRILNWISGVPYEENHFFARRGRTDGTGEWLLRHDKYRQWRGSSASTILWLHGNPGAGKTKLVSTVVDSVLKSCERFPNDEALAYFYCDRNQSHRRDPASILCSFVRQLSSPQNSDSIPRLTVELYNKRQENGFASGKLKMEESKAVIAELIQIYPQTTLVIDALDECDKETRSSFVDMLNKLIFDSPKPTKILISSRRDRDIKHRFECGPNLEIRVADSLDDIAKFVDQKIATSPQYWRDQISPELKTLIRGTLMKKSQGMFQWVSLQITALLELHRERDIRERLGKLPEDLRTAYDELYDKIQAQKASSPVIAHRAFQWVMCSRKPLSPAELVAAVCQDPDTDEIDPVDININFVLETCQNLLTVDQELGVCRFSHLSIQEYFEIHHWNYRDANGLVAKVCLALLNNTIEEQDVQPADQGNRNDSIGDLIRYAHLHWAAHVIEQGDEKIDLRLIFFLQKFLVSMDKSSMAYRNRRSEILKWLTAINRQLQLAVRDNNEARVRLLLVFRPSHSALYFGQETTRSLMLKVVEEVLEENNVRGKCLGDALGEASSRSQEAVVRLLLEAMKNLDVPNVYYGNALRKASEDGGEGVVRLLLEAMKKLDGQGENYAEALLEASRRGHNVVMQLLEEAIKFDNSPTSSLTTKTCQSGVSNCGKSKNDSGDSVVKD